MDKERLPCNPVRLGDYSVRPTRLESVIVSVGYGDYLKHTLPVNKGKLDRLVVVTEADDKDTQAVCAANGVTCVITTRHRSMGAPFNKGSAINDGWRALKPRGWLLILDADIVLPPDFRLRLNAMDLDRRNFWCAYRKHVPSYEAWKQYLADTGVATAFDVEYRNVCMGFFQLFHVSAPALAGGKVYPENSRTAAYSDVWFLHNWVKPMRARLPDICVLHLDHGPHGVNWKGRKSPRYGE